MKKGRMIDWKIVKTGEGTASEQNLRCCGNMIQTSPNVELWMTHVLQWKSWVP